MASAAVYNQYHKEEAQPQEPPQVKFKWFPRFCHCDKTPSPTWVFPRVVVFTKFEATWGGRGPVAALDVGVGGLGFVSVFIAVCKNIREGLTRA